MLTIASFLLFTALVALIAYFKTKNDDLGTESGYFLAGRSLSWYVIAGSLFLTNISAEQLAGLNANAFRNGANVMAWEATSALTLIVLAFVFLPRYLKAGITTVPQFLEKRFGKKMRITASFIFLYAIVIGFLPFVLYAGAITLGKLFDVSGLLGISEGASIWLMTITLGVVGGIYAVFGGLKAVAVSDTVNGVGLLIAGLLVPIIGLYILGDSSVLDGVRTLVAEAPDRLNAPGLSSDSNIPWHGLISGVLIINLFYWCTNQAIVQRVFAGRNLAESQKGVLAAAAMKILGVFMLVLPGIIAWQLYQDGLLQIPMKQSDGVSTGIINADMSYPILVREILPGWMTGFFGAAMFGAILSSFNSGVNSLSTVVSLDIYKQIIKPEASDRETVRIGRLFGTFTIILCIIIAPYIATADSLYTLMRTIMAVINVPIFAVILLGVISKRAPSSAAFAGLGFGMVFFYTTHFAMGDDLGFVKVHWLNLVGINLVLMLAIMGVIRWLRPLPEPVVIQYTRDVDITPWKHAELASWIIIFGFLSLYLVLSPLGITSESGSIVKALSVVVLILAVLIAAVRLIRNRSSSIPDSSKLIPGRS